MDLDFFEPWMLAMIDDAGYNGIQEQHIRRVANELIKSGKHYIERSDFEHACRMCCINPKNFTQADLDRLEEYLNS